MLFKFVINIVFWFLKSRPIVRIAMLNSSMQYDILKKNFKSKRIPEDGDILYFKESGPFYVVNRIMHHIGGRHIIWVIVSEMEMNELVKTGKKFL